MKLNTTREINEALREQMSKSNVLKMSGLAEQDAIAVGIDKVIQLTVQGDVGDFFGAFNNGAKLVLHGNAGAFIGEHMCKGDIIVRGSVGRGLGLHMKGGVIAVMGNADDELAAYMSGGTIIVSGKAGKLHAPKHGDIYLRGSADDAELMDLTYDDEKLLLDYVDNIEGFKKVKL